MWIKSITSSTSSTFRDDEYIYRRAHVKHVTPHRVGRLYGRPLGPIHSLCASVAPHLRLVPVASPFRCIVCRRQRLFSPSDIDAALWVLLTIRHNHIRDAGFGCRTLSGRERGNASQMRANAKTEPLAVCLAKDTHTNADALIIMQTHTRADIIPSCAILCGFPGTR